MSEIVINEEGDSIWIDPKEKLESIKKALLPHLQQLKLKWDRNENSQFPRKLDFSGIIANRLTLEMHKFPIVPTKYALEINHETLKQYVTCYFELIEFIMCYYDEFISTKNIFCQFLGVESFVYNRLLLSQNYDIVAEMQFVEGHLVDSNMLLAQTGKIKEKSTEIRLRSSDLGHNINIKPAIDEKPQINVIAYDVDSVKSMISGFGLNMKSIENNKK